MYLSPLTARIVHELAFDHLEAAHVGFGLAVERFLLAADLLPAVEVLAVEEQREALLQLESFLVFFEEETRYR